MRVEDFVNILGTDFYTGVPDSKLKALCNYLMDEYGIDNHHHIIAANEGNCVGIAAGYYLATGKVPVIYLQNSGEGNIINPVASLLNENVYAIPTIFVVGWRGEPGVHDEPQHVFQGQVTLKLLEDMEIASYVVDSDTTVEELSDIRKRFTDILERGKQVAFVIKKGALEYENKVEYTNDNKLTREEIIKHIVNISGDDPIISTTGKTSRELFEVREQNGQDHSHDFLTVGSMGHSSSIALGVALNQPDKKVWCIDGDGAALMHMGAMAVIGSCKPNNLVHILINNGAHESVGGFPTVGDKVDFIGIATACGYKDVSKVSKVDDLDELLLSTKKKNNLAFIEIECAIGARDNLGRPNISAKAIKEAFKSILRGE